MVTSSRAIWETGCCSIVWPGHQSKYAAQIAEAEEGTANLIQGAIPLCLATRYNVSVDCKVVAADASCQIDLYAIHSSTHYSIGPIVARPSNWSTNFQLQWLHG